MALQSIHAHTTKDIEIAPYQTARLQLKLSNKGDKSNPDDLFLFEPEVFATNLDCCPVFVQENALIGTVQLVQPAIVQPNSPPSADTTAVMALTVDPELKVVTPSETKPVQTPEIPADAPEEIQNLLRELIAEYESLFDGVLSEESFGGVQHEIAIRPGSAPVYVRPYKYKQEHLPILRELMEKYIQEGIIEEANGAWCSPSFFVPKPHGGWRFVVDMRKLNELIVRDRYQMPTVAEIFDQLNGAVLFSSADGHSGFTQLCLHPNSRKYTGFSTPMGFYQYKRMPQGIVNGPPAYSREMAKALHHIDFAHNYVDDIIIHTPYPPGMSRSLPKDVMMLHAWRLHVEHLRTVFQRCAELNIKLNPKKVIIGRKQLAFLGHIVSAEGIKPCPKKLKAIASLHPPTDVKELRKFLGMVNYYTAFIPRKAALQNPLNQLLTLSAYEIFRIFPSLSSSLPMLADTQLQILSVNQSIVKTR